jgi:hypothetical protein
MLASGFAMVIYTCRLNGFTEVGQDRFDAGSTSLKACTLFQIADYLATHGLLAE